MDRGLVYSAAWDRLPMSQVESHHRALAAHPDFDPDFCQMIDFTRVIDFELSSDDARGLSRRGMWSARARRCVVAPAAVTFGMSRAFQGWAGLGDDRYGVFRDLQAAWEWLGVEGPIPDPAACQWVTEAEASG